MSELHRDRPRQRRWAGRCRRATARTTRSQSGVRDDKVLETGLAIGSPFYDTLSSPGGARWLLTTKAPLGDGSGRATEVLTVAIDVTELRAARGRPLHRSQEDLLTGSAERRLLPDAAASTSWRVHGASTRCWRCSISTSTGLRASTTRSARSSATELLREVAVRLKARLTGDELLARLESDEFLILQIGIKRPDDAAELSPAPERGVRIAVRDPHPRGPYQRQRRHHGGAGRRPSRRHAAEERRARHVPGQEVRAATPTASSPPR